MGGEEWADGSAGRRCVAADLLRVREARSLFCGPAVVGFGLVDHVSVQ